MVKEGKIGILGRKGGMNKRKEGKDGGDTRGRLRRPLWLLGQGQESEY